MRGGGTTLRLARGGGVEGDGEGVVVNMGGSDEAGGGVSHLNHV